MLTLLSSLLAPPLRLLSLIAFLFDLIVFPPAPQMPLNGDFFSVYFAYILLALLVFFLFLLHCLLFCLYLCFFAHTALFLARIA